MGAASHQGSLLVINFDLEPECPDAELRATLQWIAASELGIPAIYFKKSQENRVEKVWCFVLDISEACVFITAENSVNARLTHLNLNCWFLTVHLKIAPRAVRTSTA